MGVKIEAGAKPGTVNLTLTCDGKREGCMKSVRRGGESYVLMATRLFRLGWAYSTGARRVLCPICSGKKSDRTSADSDAISNEG